MQEPIQKNSPPLAKGNIWLPWLICLLAALFYSYDFLLRVMPSVMIHPLMAEYQVNATTIGVLSAFYYYAYTPLQLPSGVVSDKFNPRWVLSLSALCCALGTLIFAITSNILVAYLARAMMGIGSAFAFVGALKLAALWLPKKHFALFSGITTALGTLGAMTTDTVLSHMVDAIGWRDTAFVSAVIGFVLAALLFILIQDNPKTKPALPKTDYYSWKKLIYRLLSLFANWRFCINGVVGALLFLPISVFASLWGVDFISQRFQISSAKAASMTSLIFLGMAASGPMMGWFSNVIKSRKILLMLGTGLCCLLSSLLIYAEWIPFIMLFPLLFFIGFAVGPQVLSFAVAKDLSPKGSTGLSTAATNFIVTIGAAVFQPWIGYLLHKSWDGSRTAMGTPHYSVAHYQEAFLVLIMSLVLSFLLIFFIPKTVAKTDH